MKKAFACILALCICVLSGCGNTISVETQVVNEPSVTTATELKMPDEMKAFVENPNLQWMAGMLVVIEDVEPIRGISQDSFIVFPNPGDTIQAIITARNGLDLAQRFDLMIFADGAPVEFVIEGKQYKTYPMELTQEGSSLKVEFANDFSLNLGRLDFVLSFAENPRAANHLVTYTIWIKRDGGSVSPTTLFSTVEQRLGVQGCFAGGAYNSWLWNEGIVPTETDVFGPESMSIQNGETVLLEVIASRSGFYRTVLVVNGMPVEAYIDGKAHLYIDWESSGENMLQLPITLMDVPHSGSVYTITTPLATDDLALFTVASGKVELVAKVEE